DATETLRFKTIFVHPRSGGPGPLLIWSRGSGGDRTQQLPDAVTAAKSGRRIAAAGFSLGAEVTASLAGVDDRIVAFAQKSGRGHLTGFARVVCASLGPRLGGYMATLAPVDPVRWVGAARRVPRSCSRTSGGCSHTWAAASGG